jgi:hypothetical protein
MKTEKTEKTQDKKPNETLNGRMDEFLVIRDKQTKTPIVKTRG